MNWLLQPSNFRVLVLSGLTVVAYVGAIGRRESLLWLVAALLIATLITGVIWPRWLVRQLFVTRSAPERANEGDTITLRVEVQNRGWLPRFMIELVDHLPFVGARTGDNGAGLKLLGVVGYVGGGKRRVFKINLLCEKRGLYQLGPVSLATRFPLGLVEAREQKNRSVQTLTIYPEIFPITSLPLHGTPSQIHRGGLLLPEAAGTAEFCGLREYRRGDSPRHIHWPTSARLNELMVKEMEPTAAACLCLALDLAGGSNVGKGRHTTLEYAVKIAASIARYACTQGMPFRLIGSCARPLTTTLGSGDNHYRALLEELAIIDSDGHIPYADVLEDASQFCERGETMVVFLSEPETRLERTLESISLLRSRGLHVLAISLDRASFLKTVEQKLKTQTASHAALLNLGARCMHIRKGDDLLQLFNA